MHTFRGKSRGPFGFRVAKAANSFFKKADISIDEHFADKTRTLISFTPKKVKDVWFLRRLSIRKGKVTPTVGIFWVSIRWNRRLMSAGQKGRTSKGENKSLGMKRGQKGGEKGVQKCLCLGRQHWEENGLLCIQSAPFEVHFLRLFQFLRPLISIYYCSF